MSIPARYSKHYSLPPENYVLVADEGIDWKSLQRGILFVMARWSGASVLAFRALNAAISKVPDLGNISVYIYDYDEDAAKRLFESMGMWGGGHGETFWIKEGRMVAELMNYKSNDLRMVVERTRRLLDH